jgi:hypothetical protein
MRFVTKKEAKQNGPARAMGSRRKDGLNEPVISLGIKLHPEVPMDLFVQSAGRYSNKPWYGAIVKNGWPGVRGEVQLGVPVVDKFNEIVVVYRDENGYMKSKSLGKAPQKR